jgi:DNA-binding response OmpR family regulator/Tfp pilus assembly protein PilF
MALIDRDIGQARALVIDHNPTSRSVVSAQLRDLGVGHVKQIGRASDARQWLEHRPCDIVLCNGDSDSAEMSGQDLLDELRREQLLPYSTVFIMLTGAATYAKVVEGAESALDAYLVKPFSASALADRLLEARKRKRALKDIFDALDSRRIDLAIDLCLQRFRRRQPYAMLAARLGAEVLLRESRLPLARELFDEVLAQRSLPWARLGVCRALLACGDGPPARRAIEALIEDVPDYADACDVLARLQVDQGDLAAAHRSFRRSVELTPGCLLRLQHCGTLAFYQAEPAEALRLLDRTVSEGLHSKLFDAMTLMLIALLRFDEGDAKRLQVALGQLVRFADKHVVSVRLQRFVKVAHALRCLLARQTSEAEAHALELAAEADDERFDFEGANLLLSLWTRLPDAMAARSSAAASDGQPAPSSLVRRIGLRFCVSKSLTEVLLASAQRRDPAADTLRACDREVSTLAQQAMAFSLQGQPRQAVQALLQQGLITRNAKLIEMAALVARRHQDAIADCATLLDDAQALQTRFCQPITHIAGIRRTGRSPGGLMLRT